ncbi:MAG: transposase [Rhizobacter sp.]|nr:transposase [Rhizobacter sp.]
MRCRYRSLQSDSSLRCCGFIKPPASSPAAHAEFVEFELSTLDTRFGHEAAASQAPTNGCSWPTAEVGQSQPPATSDPLPTPAPAYGKADSGQPASCLRRAYDTRGFVRVCRDINVTPHEAQNLRRIGGSAIDGRTTWHIGYRISQRMGKRSQPHRRPPIHGRPSWRFGHRARTSATQPQDLRVDEPDQCLQFCGPLRKLLPVGGHGLQHPCSPSTTGSPFVHQ